jgi:hypothetical protein
MPDVLHYGDKILLTAQAGLPGYQFWGMVWAEGFFNEDLLFQKIDNLKSKSCNINIRSYMFEVRPVLRYEFHTDYFNCLKQYQDIENLEKNRFAEKYDKTKLKVVLASLSCKLQILNDKMKKENLRNKDIIKNMKGEIVRYGATIQLVHSSSRSLVTPKLSSPNTKSIAFGTRVSTKLSEQMHFTFLPISNSFDVGDAIVIGDEVVIKSISNGFYFSINLDSDKSKDGLDFDISGINTNNASNLPMFTGKDYLSTCLTHKIRNNWKTVLVRAFKVDKKYLHWDDIIRIRHKESGNYICHEPQEESSNNEESKDCNEIIIKSYNNVIGEGSTLDYCRNVWQIDFTEFSYDTMLRVNEHNIKLVHLKSLHENKTMSWVRAYRRMNEESTEIKNINIFAKEIIYDEVEPRRAFYMQENKDMVVYVKAVIGFETVQRPLYFRNTRHGSSLKSVSNSVAPDNKVKLKEKIKINLQIDSASLYMDLLEKPMGRLSTSLRSVHIRPSFADRTIDYASSSKNRVIFSKKSSDENSFELERFSKKEKMYFFYGKHVTQYFTTSINIRNYESFLKKVLSITDKLIKYLFDKEDCNEYNPQNDEETEGGSVNPLKQKMLKDFGVFEILTRVLPKLNNEFSLIKKKVSTQIGNYDSFSANEEVNKAKRRCFDCIFLLIQDSILNQQYLLKWLDEFINNFFSTKEADEIDKENYQKLIKIIIQHNNTKIQSKFNVDVIAEKINVLPTLNEKFIKLIETLRFLHSIFNSTNNMCELYKLVHRLLFEKFPFLIKQIHYDELQKKYCIDNFAGQKTNFKIYNKSHEEKYHFSKYIKAITLYTENNNPMIIKDLQKRCKDYLTIFQRHLKIGDISETLKRLFLTFIKNVWVNFYPNSDVRFSLYLKNFKSISTFASTTFFIDTDLFVAFETLENKIKIKRKDLSLNIIERSKKSEALSSSKPKLAEINAQRSIHNEILNVLLEIIAEPYFPSYSSEYHDVVFKFFNTFLKIGFIKAKAQINQITERLMNHIHNSRTVSEPILDFLINIFQFEYSYSFNMSLKKLQVGRTKLEDLEVGIFNCLRPAQNSLHKPGESQLRNVIDFACEDLFSNSQAYLSLFGARFMSIAMECFNNRNHCQMNILQTFRSIFQLRVNYIAHLKKSTFCNTENSNDYYYAYEIRLNLLEILKESNEASVIDYLLSTIDNLVSFIIKRFGFEEIYNTIISQVKPNSEEYAVQMVYFYLYTLKMAPDFDLQGIVYKLEIVDLVFQVLEALDLNFDEYLEFYSKTFFFLFLVVKNNQEIAKDIWKRFREQVFSSLGFLSSSSLMFICELTFENAYISRNEGDVKEILIAMMKTIESSDDNARRISNQWFFIFKLMNNLTTLDGRIVIANRVFIVNTLQRICDQTKAVKVITLYSTDQLSRLSRMISVSLNRMAIVFFNVKLYFLSEYTKCLEILSKSNDYEEHNRFPSEISMKFYKQHRSDDSRRPKPPRNQAKLPQLSDS